MNTYEEMKEKNPQFCLRDFKPHRKGHWQGLGIGRTQDGSLRARIMAGKRLLALTDDESLHGRMLENKIHSALQISALPKEDFVSRYAGRLGISKQDACRLHGRAVKKRIRLLHAVAALKTSIGAKAFQNTKGISAGIDAQQYFENLPDYESLFGAQYFCTCGQCKSVFGPAAYFVDLMRIVDQYITECNEIPDALKLKTRRPDLEKLQLTCENTNELVPYVQIINERLYQGAAEFAGADPYEAMASMKYPFSMPCVLPLEQIRAALGQTGVVLADIYSAWQKDHTAVLRERAGLSIQEYEMLTGDCSKEGLAEYYGLMDVAGLQGLFAADTFLETARISRAQLELLLYQNLSKQELSSGAACRLYINKGQKAGDWIRIEDGRIVCGAQTDALDRINRLLRLSMRLQRDYDILDYLLSAFGNPQGIESAAIQPETMEKVIKLLLMARQLELHPAMLAAMEADMKLYGKDVDGKCLFDSVYNHICLYQNKKYRPDVEEPLEWHVQEDAELAGYLAACLGLDEAKLIRLQKLLMDGETVRLTVGHLSLLYRHRLMMRLLGMDIGQYAVFQKLMGWEKKTSFTADEMQKAIGINAIIRQCGCHAYLLDYFINGTQSSYIVSICPPKVQEEAMRYLAAKAYTIDTPDVEKKVVEDLSICLDVSSALLEPVINIAAAACAPLPVDHWAAVFITFSDARPVYLEKAQQILETVSRWVCFARMGNLTEGILQSIWQAPQQYGLDGAFSCQISQAADLLRYMLFLSAQGASQDAACRMAQERQKGDPVQAAACLAEAFGWDPDDLSWLADGITEEGMIPWVFRMAECIRLMSVTGAGQYTVERLLSIADAKDLDYQELEKTAGFVEDGLKKVYGELWEQAWQALAQKFYGIKRNALLDISLLSLHQSYPDIRTCNDVYKFYLIDVQMDETTMISYVKEGLNALQLYLQRCRMREESYVKNVEIKESWWSWIMNYRDWEANRKIFVFPENYLLPSVRGSRTSLFRNMESALMQADASKGYIGEQYGRYMDDFAEISQVTPVETYFTKDTHYLFGRSNSQDGSYYYCEKKDGEWYGEWKKIEALIRSEYISPVFVFHRLYLFWVELKCVTENTVEGEGGDVHSRTSSAYKANICYTSLNMQGKWICAQTLVEDELVYYEGAEEEAVTGLPLFSNVYQMEDIRWNKVQAYRIPDGQGDKDRLLLVYGTFVNALGEVSPLPEPAGSGCCAQFIDRAREIAIANNQMVRAKMTGYLPAGFAWIYQEDLLRVDANQYYALDAYMRPGVNRAQFCPAKRTGGGRAAGVVQTGDTLAAPWSRDYDFKEKSINQYSFTSETISPQQSKAIFQNLSAAGFITGENKVDKDRLRSQDLRKALYGLYDGSLGADIVLQVQDALFRAAGGIQLFADTGENASIAGSGNEAGGFLAGFDGESFYLYPKQAVLAWETKERPRITRDYFVASGMIDSQKSGQIYDQYAMYRVVEPDGSVNVEKFEGLRYDMILGGLILSKALTDEQAYLAHEKLLTVPAAYTTQTVEDPDRRTISGSLYIGRMPVSELSFLSIGYKITDAFGCMEALHRAGIVDADGFVAKECFEDSDFLNRCRSALADLYKPEAYHLLMGYPQITDDYLVDAAIDSNLSKEIIDTFKMYQIIDSAGRINLAYLAASDNMVLGNLVLSGKISQAQSEQVVRRLYQAPALRIAAYREQMDGTMFYDGLSFAMERMSNQSVKKLKQKVYTQGVDALLKLETQEMPIIPALSAERFGPDKNAVLLPDALDAAQPDFAGLYGEYHWEIFYHLPMLVAEKLKSNCRNQEAAGWYEYVFCPSNEERLVAAHTCSDVPGTGITPEQSEEIAKRLVRHQVTDEQGRVCADFGLWTDLTFLMPLITPEQTVYVRNLLLNYTCTSKTGYYWNFKPFRNLTLDDIQKDLSSKEALKRYNDSPFDPHAIAKLRIGAYEKYTFMEYIDNYIQWGDKEFALCTWESISTATMLYVTAYSLLGERPKAGLQKEGEAKDYRYFYERYKGDIPQFLLELEAVFSDAPEDSYEPSDELEAGDVYLYFGIPENEKLLNFWDIIEDRLYKIRHSMDIYGNKRNMPLFEPPKDPMALAKMVQGGAGGTTAAAAAQSGGAVYHFPFHLQQAKYYASILSQTGASLLSAMEKSDSERFALLAQTQEKIILDMTVSLKKYREQELEKSIAGMEKSMDAAKEREGYYQKLIEAGISDSEQQSMDAAKAAMAFSASAQAVKTASAIGYAVPQVGSPFAMTYGGQQIGNVLTATAGVLDMISTVYSWNSQQTAVMAGYERRAAEWELQKKLAAHEKESIGQQIEAVKKQWEAARFDSSILQKQIELKQEVCDALSRKFTNQQLYQWMTGKLTGLLWQAYQMTLHAAYEAQTAYRIELDSEETFIVSEYWDSGKKGLLSGEALLLSLNEMELSYYKKNVRRLEIEKNISLAECIPQAFADLKEKGECSFALTERMFDEDYPGHYARKIKTVSISVPAVVAPYETLKAVLAQNSSVICAKPDLAAVKCLLNQGKGEWGTGLIENWCANQKIAISRGIDDSGLFLLNFQEEKYLPFEGTGAVSQWTLTMPKECNSFDYSSISDVVLNIKYTALADGHLEEEVRKLVWKS